MKNIFGKKLYSLRESYVITYLAFLSAGKFIYAKRHEILSQQFIERIMLSVTEVNGCQVCSYAHTKMALESGMGNEEIQNMLAGIKDDVPPDEMQAVMFAQHYADSRGLPSKESWERIVESYGITKAQGILGAIRIIMWGNAYGIAWSSFIDRFKGKGNERSNLPYELGMVITSVFYVPIALVHSFLAKMFGMRPIKF
jgi:AhpD family alkylhydroperoxidase